MDMMLTEDLSQITQPLIRPGDIANINNTKSECTIDGMNMTGKSYVSDKDSSEKSSHYRTSFEENLEKSYQLSNCSVPRSPTKLRTKKMQQFRSFIEHSDSSD